ncbi:MAG: MerC domain-containing protein [Algibacter sp.]
MENNKIKNNTIDLVALSSAIICAVHCAVVSIVFSLFSLHSLHFLKNPYIELTFISFGLVFVLTSLWPSYKKVYHQAKHLLYSAWGFAFIALGRLNLELWKIVNTVIRCLYSGSSALFKLDINAG